MRITGAVLSGSTSPAMDGVVAASLLSSVVGALPCPVGAVDPTGRILAANPAWDRMAAQAGADTSQRRSLAGLFPTIPAVPPLSSTFKAAPLAASPAGAASWWDLMLVPHPEVPDVLLVTAHEATDQVLSRREAEDANAALGPMNHRLRLAQDAAGIGTWEWDAKSNRQSWSQRQFRLYGLDPAATVPPSLEEWIAMVLPEDRPLIDGILEHCRNEGTDVFQVEFRIRRADNGEIRWLLSLGQVTELDGAGGYARVLGVNIDITERRRREDALRANQARLRSAAEAAGVYAWDLDLTTGALVLGDGVENALGLPSGGLGGSADAFRALVHPEDRAGIAAELQRAVAGETKEYRATFRMLRTDGTIRWAEARGTVIRDESGRAIRVVGMDHDITHQRAMLDDLLERKARLRLFIERAPASLAMFDADMRFIAVSQRFIADHGLTPHRPDQLVGVRVHDVLPNLPESWVIIHRAVLNGETRTGDGDLYVRPDGQHEAVSWSMAPWFAADGSIGGAMLATELTTARREAEAAVAESEAKFRALAEAMPQLVFTATADGVADYKNKRWLDHSGMTLDEALGDGWINLLHPEDRDGSIAAWNHALRAGEPMEREHRLRAKDGTYRWFLSRSVPLRSPEDGRIMRWLGTATDVSDIVAAREKAARDAKWLESRIAERTKALTEAAVELQAEMRRRQDIQSALLQSQKLETLGQLTAGVAHDFNNVLAAIQGSFEMIARDATQPRVTRMVELGTSATKRAVSLTRQLLDFGRGESLLPVVLDVDRSIRQANELIGHVVGPHIARFLNIQRDVWPVLTDGHQLEVALLNLAINAKDAMPDGGRLVLDARNLAPEQRPEALPKRDYVCIAVSDSGEGMPPEVLARATESFFTTKPAGKGTGLGLPMVRAFALRSGGLLQLESRKGIGTTVRIILPRAAVSGMDTPDAAPIRAGDPKPGRKITILLVEDDEQVRQITSGYLLHQGFDVIEAPHAEAALVLGHSAQSLDLLLTDVTLPGVDGVALADRLRNERPGLPVVFMTGSAARHDLAGEHVLLKPFVGADLIRAIERRLGQPPAADISDGGLILRLKNPALVAAYLVWRSARRGAVPPRMIDMDWGGLQNRDDTFTVTVERNGEEVGFRYLRVGSALAARYGQPMDAMAVTPIDNPAGDDEILGSLAAAYASAARTFAPSYEYARYDLGDPAPVLFERLILPVSDDGLRVTHLVGVALFTGAL